MQDLDASMVILDFILGFFFSLVLTFMWANMASRWAFGSGCAMTLVFTYFSTHELEKEIDKGKDPIQEEEKERDVVEELGKEEEELPKDQVAIEDETNDTTLINIPKISSWVEK
jgi:hypothetical protein